MASLVQKLNILLEDPAEAVGSDPLQTAMDIVRDLDNLKQRVQDLQNQLQNKRREAGGQLALGLRKQEPGLDLAVDSDSCKVGYDNESLDFSPDARRGIWVIKSSNPKFVGEIQG